MFSAEPDSPTIQTVASSSGSIELSWKLAENDGGRPVQKTIIQYQEFNETNWQSETISADPRIVRHTIHNLKSGTWYTLRVIAVNEIGESRPSIKHSQKTNMNVEGTKISQQILLPQFSYSSFVLAVDKKASLFF